MTLSANEMNKEGPYTSLRNCILKTLYEYFKKYPYASIELIQLNDDCSVDNETLNWNMVYLEKKGYLELDRSNECPPFIACTASISAVGIDYVENKLYA